MYKMIKVTNDKELQDILDNVGSTELVLVKFGANWCKPCSTLDPILEDVLVDYDVRIVKVDVDECPDIAGEFRVMSIPTTFFIKNGVTETMLNGAASKDTIVGLIEEIQGS
jgi:thioredoxin 1